MLKKNMTMTTMLEKMIFPMIFLLIWSIICNIDNTIPSPLDIVYTLKKMLLENELIKNIGVSTVRLFLGYIVSTLIGLLGGIIFYKCPLIANNFRGVFSALQTLPNVCWVPIGLMIFGVSEVALLFLIIVGTSFYICVETERALKGVDKTLLKVGQTMGLNEKDMYKRVIIPGAIPGLITGFRGGWSFAWRALMSGEVINSTIGIGNLLKSGQSAGDLSQVISMMVVILFIGIIINKLVFERIEKKINKKYGI